MTAMSVVIVSENVIATANVSVTAIGSGSADVPDPPTTVAIVGETSTLTRTRQSAITGIVNARIATLAVIVAGTVNGIATAALPAGTLGETMTID